MRNKKVILWLVFCFIILAYFFNIAKIIVLTSFLIATILTILEE